MEPAFGRHLEVCATNQIPDIRSTNCIGRCWTVPLRVVAQSIRRTGSEGKPRTKMEHPSTAVCLHSRHTKRQSLSHRQSEIARPQQVRMLPTIPSFSPFPGLRTGRLRRRPLSMGIEVRHEADPLTLLERGRYGSHPWRLSLWVWQVIPIVLEEVFFVVHFSCLIRQSEPIYLVFFTVSRGTFFSRTRPRYSCGPQ